MGASHLGGAPDQAGARGPGQRAERGLAAPSIRNMKAELAVSLRSLSVRRGDKWVLRDITWQLRPGERWALLGHNGAGKTQLLKLVSGDVCPTPTRASPASPHKTPPIHPFGPPT